MTQWLKDLPPLPLLRVSPSLYIINSELQTHKTSFLKKERKSKGIWSSIWHRDEAAEGVPTAHNEVLDLFFTPAAHLRAC